MDERLSMLALPRCSKECIYLINMVLLLISVSKAKLHLHSQTPFSLSSDRSPCPFSTIRSHIHIQTPCARHARATRAPIFLNFKLFCKKLLNISEKVTAFQIRLA